MVSLHLRIIREKNRCYRLLLRLLQMLQPNRTTVFLFHDLLESKEAVTSPFVISQQSFEFFLLRKIQDGWSPISFDVLSDIINGKQTSKSKQFIVSFDDANTSVLTKAYPFLKAHAIPFIIFITPELTQKPNFLTEAQILQLSKEPLCTIGSHGMKHSRFRYLSNTEVEESLKQSKSFLEGLTTKSISCFAFPYGRIVECSSSNLEVLKQIQTYDFSFSALSGNLGQQWLSGRYFLPRVNVDESMVEKLLKP